MFGCSDPSAINPAPLGAVGGPAHNDPVCPPAPGGKLQSPHFADKELETQRSSGDLPKVTETTRGRERIQSQGLRPFPCRIPASLAAAKPRRTSRACRAHLGRPGQATEAEGPAGIGWPSVWPSVPSQKQTVPSGYAAHVPKITQVRQHQPESGLACWLLLVPESSGSNTATDPPRGGPRAHSQKANVRGLRSGSLQEPWQLCGGLGTSLPLSVPYALLHALPALGLLCGH